MKTRKTLVALTALLSLASLPAFAQNSGIDSRAIYVGAGLGINSVSGSDNGIGYQFFAGYDLPIKAQPLRFAVEAGYMDTGNMDVNVNTPFGSYKASARARGLWATGVGFLPVTNQIDLLARAGLDFGDDDGAMFGIGAGLNLNRQTQLRLEYVARDNVDSVQLNAAFHLQ